ncbi:MAG: PSP1 domain-containing protein [Bacillota bacterium]|jgi:cell fate regulator YaaT (PSP1 superfamily)|nr:stage 0 sporulation family protein [Candidatus Fermentithermobacillaceae bacterium]
MPVVVGVRFKERGKIYYFDPGDIRVNQDDRVLVETVRGIELGFVALGPKDVPPERLVLPLKKVIRLATPEDLVTHEANRKKALDAMETARAKIADHGLEMRLVDAEFTFDGSRVVLYFTADGRIDFRELVKDLASTLRTRVELRQIGVRDQAKLTGGIGPCGRPLCCASFLNDFLPVSIKMAKEQNLSLNPTKISGTCGRLLCCLRFECEHYEDAKSTLPPVGAKVITPEGEGKVVAQNALKSSLSVELEGGKVQEFPAEEVEEKKA